MKLSGSFLASLFVAFLSSGAEAKSKVVTYSYSGDLTLTSYLADGTTTQNTVKETLVEYYDTYPDGTFKTEFHSVAQLLGGSPSTSFFLNPVPLLGPVKGFSMELWVDKNGSGKPDIFRRRVQVFGEPGNVNSINHSDGTLLGYSLHHKNANGKRVITRDRSLIDGEGRVLQRQQDELTEQ